MLQYWCACPKSSSSQVTLAMSFFAKKKLKINWSYQIKFTLCEWIPKCSGQFIIVRHKIWRFVICVTVVALLLNKFNYLNSIKFAIINFELQMCPSNSWVRFRIAYIFRVLLRWTRPPRERCFPSAASRTCPCWAVCRRSLHRAAHQTFQSRPCSTWGRTSRAWAPGRSTCDAAAWPSQNCDRAKSTAAAGSSTARCDSSGHSGTNYCGCPASFRGFFCPISF